MRRADPAPAARRSLAPPPMVPRRPAHHLAGRLLFLGLLPLPLYLAAHFGLPQSAPNLAEPTASVISQWPFWQWVAALPDLEPQLAVGLALALAVVPLAAYVTALWLAWRAPAAPRALAVVVGLALTYYLAGVLALPNSSHDLYGYIIFARVPGIYGADPYSVPLAAYPGDPYLPYVSPGWANSTTPYGPVWTYLSALLVRLAGEPAYRPVLALRGALLACNLANLALIALILRRHNPGQILPGLLLYAWNPIVVLKGQSHNEPVMAFFLLLGVYLGLRGRAWLGLMAVALSALTKFITAPLLLPSLAFALGRPSRRTLMWLSVVAGALVLAAGLLLWPAREAVFRLARVPGYAPGAVPPLRVLIAGLATLAVLPWATVFARRSPRAWLTSLGVVLLAFLFFFPNSTYAWYLITLLAVLSLVDSPALVVAGVVLTVSAVLNNVLGSVVAAFVPVPVAAYQFIRWGMPLLVLSAAVVRFGRRVSPARLGLGVARLPARESDR